MNARDELTTLVLGRTAPRAADAILTAGYCKPRVITTFEEVICLAPHTILQGKRLRDAGSNIFQVADHELEEESGLYVMGLDGVRPFSLIRRDLPATVLYEPEPQP